MRSNKRYHGGFQAWCWVQVLGKVRQSDFPEYTPLIETFIICLLKIPWSYSGDKNDIKLGPTTIDSKQAVKKEKCNEETITAVVKKGNKLMRQETIEQGRVSQPTFCLNIFLLLQCSCSFRLVESVSTPAEVMFNKIYVCVCLCSSILNVNDDIDCRNVLRRKITSHSADSIVSLSSEVLTKFVSR